MVKLGSGLSMLFGGARSGKSDLAVKLGEQWPGEVTFVATATAGDDDMTERIARHQDERPDAWRLVESPHFASADCGTLEAGDLVIVDCLTLLVANLLFEALSVAEILDHVDQLGTSLARRRAPTIVISNEVGMGVHPETELGRAYRDMLGRANRAMADAAQTSLLVVAGKVLPLHQLELELELDS